MIAKALANFKFPKSVKKGTQLGIDSLKIVAKVRLFLESTKDLGRFLLKESLTVDQYPHQKQTPQKENRLTKASGFVKVESPACFYGLS